MTIRCHAGSHAAGRVLDRSHTGSHAAGHVLIFSHAGSHVLIWLNKSGALKLAACWRDCYALCKGRLEAQRHIRSLAQQQQQLQVRVAGLAAGHGYGYGQGVGVRGMFMLAVRFTQAIAPSRCVIVGGGYVS